MGDIEAERKITGKNLTGIIRKAWYFIIKHDDTIAK